MKLESLEELRVFTQIVESGSLTEAARALGMPANTVSRRLASLEDRLGTQLLARTTRSNSLTEAGRTMLARARRILDEVQATETVLAQQGSGLTAEVRIGVPSLLTHDALKALKPLLEQEPGLRLHVSVRDRPVNPISEGLDVCIIGGGLSDSTLVVRKLVNIRMVLCASKTYLNENGIPAEPRELAHHTLIRFAGPPGGTWVLKDDDGNEVEVPVDCRIAADDGRTLVDSMTLGLGIGFTSRRVLNNHPSLQQVLPGWSFTPFPVYAVYASSRGRSEGLQAVVRCLQQRLEETA